MIRVLFVCTGNICRSPMADGVFQDMVERAGLQDQIEVDSAGTGAWHIGESAHRGTLNILKKNGIHYDGQARRISPQDMKSFDYVLAMDNSNMRSLQQFKSSDAEVKMFLSYAQDAGTVTANEVPDPYYNDKFDLVYDLVKKGSEALLAHIREKHNI